MEGKEKQKWAGRRERGVTDLGFATYRILYIVLKDHTYKIRLPIFKDNKLLN